jgi:hypothetical protein
MRKEGSPTFLRTLVVLLAVTEVALFFGVGTVPPQSLLARSARCERPSAAADSLNDDGPRFTTGDDASCAAHAAPPFWTLGVAVVTDKVTMSPASISMSHAYQFAYERYLRPRRCEKLDVLEIGLGCGMPYKDEGGVEVPKYLQAGHSIPIWLAFLPRAKVNIFEYGKDCAHDFMEKDPLKIGEPLRTRVKMFIGDQSKEADLLKAMDEIGPQDIIIDDGGHSMMQQEVSLRVLFKFLKPGGFCACRCRTLSSARRVPHPFIPPLRLLSPTDILEDLQSSYSWMDPAWHDKPGALSHILGAAPRFPHPLSSHLRQGNLMGWWTISQK